MSARRNSRLGREKRHLKKTVKAEKGKVARLRAKKIKKAEGSHIAKLKESRGSSHVQMKEDSLESDILGS